MHVVLDTNVLDEHLGKPSQAMRALGVLRRDDEVAIAIPYIVEQEYRSHLQENARKALVDASKALGALDHSLPGLGFSEEIQALGAKLSQLKHQGFHSSVLEDWIKEFDVEVIYPDEDHSREVIESYFNGSRPFKQKKNKNDFPDALIWMLVKQHAAENDVIFITNDNGFKDADATGLSITLHAKLEDFLRTPKIQTLLTSAQEAENVQRLSEMPAEVRATLAAQIQRNIESYLNEIGTIDLGRYLRTGFVDSFGDIQDIELELREIENYGEGNIVIPLSFNAHIEYEEEIPFDEYMTEFLDDRVSLDPGIFEDDNFTSRHYSVSRGRTFDFFGSLRLNFGESLSQDLNSKRLLEELSAAEMVLENIEYEISHSQ